MQIFQFLVAISLRCAAVKVLSNISNVISMLTGCLTFYQVLRELKDSLAEKEGRVSSLTIQLDEAENHLQKTRQDLYIEQEHTAELEAEVR